MGFGLVVGVGLGWVRALAVPGTVNTPLSMPTVIGGFLDYTSMRFHTGLRPATFLDLVRQLATVVSLLAAGWVALRWETGSRAAALKAVAVVVAATLLMSPVVHIWYFLWLVPFVAPLRLSRVGRLWLIAVALVMGMVAPLDSSLHGAYLAIIIGSLVSAVVTAVLLLTRASRLRLGKIADAEWLPVP